MLVVMFFSYSGSIEPSIDSSAPTVRGGSVNRVQLFGGPRTSFARFVGTARHGGDVTVITF